MNQTITMTGETYDAMIRERDELRAEVERLERKMKAHREVAVAAIAGTEKQLTEIRAENERLRAAHSERTMSLVDARDEIALLRALIERHNEECRECPVIEA